MLTRTFYLFSLLLMALLVSCETGESDQAIGPDGGLRTSDTCPGFRYPDTLFFFREQPTPNVVLPVAAQPGRYGSSPEGLSLNATTGAININASWSGLRYRVWFVRAGSADTCTRFVTISGVDYRSRVYELGRNELLAQPYYNANRLALPPCADDDDEDDDDDGCEFDDGRDDDDGDGLADEPPAGQEVIPLGIAISKQTGVIDLRQTVNNGTFGTTPVNGRSRTVRIYYRLNDASNRALNFIDVTLHWYATLAQVPAQLLAQVNAKNSAMFRRAAPLETTTEVMNLLIRRPRPTRPPDIVLVGR